MRNVLHMAQHFVAENIVRLECWGNIFLVGCTGAHEYGNIVGYACVPILIILFIHLFVHE